MALTLAAKQRRADRSCRLGKCERRQTRVTAMSEPRISTLRSGHSTGHLRLVEPSRPEPASRSGGVGAGGDAALAARFDPEQLSRDFAEIEQATAALRRAVPALEAWTRPPVTGGRPLSVWVLIAFLWLSSALATAGGLAALASLLK